MIFLVWHLLYSFIKTFFCSYSFFIWFNLALFSWGILAHNIFLNTYHSYLTTWLFFSILSEGIEHIEWLSYSEI